MSFSLDFIGPYALVILAGLFVHACFQLSLSMLTVMASHAIGASKRHGAILKLSLSYTLGAFIATLALLVLSTSFFVHILPPKSSPLAWIILCGLSILVGWCVLLFYYRKVKGTRLWIPRSLVEAATARAKKVRGFTGALGLGLMMVALELPFLIAPLAIAGAILSTLPSLERTIGVLAYTFAATMPLIIITIMIGGGHKISVIQRWREDNKQFLQWTSGLTLILIGVYLFATNIWGQTI